MLTVNKHKPWIESSYHGIITENTDAVLLDPPLVALDKDAPVPYAGEICGFHVQGLSAPFEAVVLNRTSGEGRLRARGPIDCERQREFTFIIQAHDCGTGPKGHAKKRSHKWEIVERFSPVFGQWRYHGSGNIRNTESLSFDKKSHYKIRVTAFDCGQKRATQDTVVHIHVKPICKPGWQGWSKLVDYEPGMGGKLLFPKMHLETCAGSVSWIRTTVELETSGAGRGCDRQSYSERSLQKLCEMNRHHYSLYVHNCRLVFLLRTDYTQTDSFRPAEFHWKLEQICDKEWHYYIISVDFPVVTLYVDGVTFDPYLVTDDWPIHSSQIDVQLTVGACWQGGEVSKAKFTQYFRGSLSGLTIRPGKIESQKIISCLQSCKEGLDITSPESLGQRIKFHLNPAQSLVVMEGEDLEQMNAALRKVTYINSRQFPTKGARHLWISTAVQ
ncbi:hypothetical protein cypCar_00013073 [Cyprinus carpio]|nr:hypothetical protein cypCar_00013073 [Cyprinus carpio]